MSMRPSGSRGSSVWFFGSNLVTGWRDGAGSIKSDSSSSCLSSTDSCAAGAGSDDEIGATTVCTGFDDASASRRLPRRSMAAAPENTGTSCEMCSSVTSGLNWRAGTLVNSYEYRTSIDRDCTSRILSSYAPLPKMAMVPGWGCETTCILMSNDAVDPWYSVWPCPRSSR